MYIYDNNLLFDFITFFFCMCILCIVLCMPWYLLLLRTVRYFFLFFFYCISKATCFKPTNCRNDRIQFTNATEHNLQFLKFALNLFFRILCLYMFKSIYGYHMSLYRFLVWMKQNKKSKQIYKNKTFNMAVK